MLTGPQKIAAALREIRGRIAAAADAAGREPSTVTLIGVSKTQPLAAVRDALAAGLVDFGENYVQEATAKLRELSDTRAVWHFIGALQGNKTRPVAENFHWVHTVDRPRIAERLSAQRPYHAAALNVCLQVHLGDEPTKAGVAPAGLAALADAVAGLPRLALRGLMCLPPAETEPARQRYWFAELRRLRDGLNRAGHRLDVLSMGMSGDFELAVAEGATHLRIGTALFGPRR